MKTGILSRIQKPGSSKRVPISKYTPSRVTRSSKKPGPSRSTPLSKVITLSRGASPSRGTQITKSDTTRQIILIETKDNVVIGKKKKAQDKLTKKQYKDLIKLKRDIKNRLISLESMFGRSSTKRTQKRTLKTKRA